MVLFYAINGKADDFAAAFVPLVSELCDSAKLCCANGCEVFRVRKKNRPTVADPVVELDLAIVCLGCKVWDDVINAKAHSVAPFVWGDR